AEYSGGRKRRVAQARALLADFDVLFLDEPYKGLDEDTRRQVRQVVGQHTLNKTVILVTHDPSDAQGLEQVRL
ncbi:MAG: ABC transporter ATP-binding protein, partial [Clostridia bacterium]|nr:ABC transporter ATP-binding protein [Clostridia bacterium]